MSKPLTIKVKFDKNTKTLLEFIEDTKEGKFTKQKPDVTLVTYKRLVIQEQDKNPLIQENEEEEILFGIS